MKTELTFLLDLLDIATDDADISRPNLKKIIKNRIREVEKYYTIHHTGSGYSTASGHNVVSRGTISTIPTTKHDNPLIESQAPSTRRIMEANPDLIPKPPIPTTLAAAEALNKRQELIASALSQKVEPGRKSPRKF